jgi:phosphoribosylformimino-5-aminoimidazole carboxamide ribotide isomerase
MLIPSIDLQNGLIVQLVQGERLAIESQDIEAWIEKFASFPCVQLIDLDAAMSRGHNDDLVRRIAARLPCRVGGGVRTVGRAEELLAAGAQAVIAGSALFLGPAQWGGAKPSDPSSIVNHDFARALADTIGPSRVIGAVDARAGRVVIHGWRTVLPITPIQAVHELERYCDEFLYTIVDKEGLMKGTDMDAIRALRDSTTRKVTAAGGITTREEIDALDAMKVDAVVGMAIYTGLLSLE